jgi:hypothetical protein
MFRPRSAFRRTVVQLRPWQIVVIVMALAIIANSTSSIPSASPSRRHTDSAKVLSEPCCSSMMQDCALKCVICRCSASEIIRGSAIT